MLEPRLWKQWLYGKRSGGGVDNGYQWAVEVVFQSRAASEALYYFKVNMTGITVAVLTPVVITHPQNNSSGVESNPTFTRTGPAGWEGILAYAYPDNVGNGYSANLPATATSWTPGSLPPGPNELLLIYFWDDYAGITLTTPTNSLGTPLAGGRGTGI